MFVRGGLKSIVGSNDVGGGWFSKKLEIMLNIGDGNRGIVVSRYMVDPRVAGPRMKLEITTHKSLKPLMMMMMMLV